MKTILSLFCLLIAGTSVYSATPDVRTLDERLAEIEAKPSEKRINQIGWAKDIREATRLGKELTRPVFLFTHDGRINTGRC